VENAGVPADERGFIPVDEQQRTNVPHIFRHRRRPRTAPMLAHKAVHEDKVAADRNSYFDATMIPSLAYTDPEVAWVGLTENEAKAAGVNYGKGGFPCAASGRSLSLGRDEGLIKLLFDKTTDRIIGCGIVGPNAGDLIAEAALAIEMGADATDIGLTIHPTLSESVAMAAEASRARSPTCTCPRSSAVSSGRSHDRHARAQGFAARILGGFPMPTLGRTGITGVHDYVIVWRVVQDRADNDQIRRAVTGLAVSAGRER
jgi:dihydrolipoamide dehydrogenase